MSPKINKIVTITGVWLCRILAGGAFLFSGFAKGVDPWGTLFKFEQYFAAWGLTEPRSLILSGVILLSLVEFLLGVAILTGMYRRKAPWFLLIMMLFFLPLTIYIAAGQPVDDCGCFGDAIILSNSATVTKNVILLAMSIVLVLYNRRVAGVFQDALQWIVSVVSGFYILIISFFGYNYQPLVDFRTYPIGSSLTEEASQGEVRFVYERDGHRISFPADSLPSPDDGWEFVERSGAVSERYPLLIEDEEGENVTDFVLADEGDLLLVVIPEPERADLSGTMYINRIYEATEVAEIEMAALLGDASSDDLERWKDLSMAEYPVYSSDKSSLKSLSRGNISFVYLHDGRITQKNSLSMMSTGRLERLKNGEATIESIVGFPASTTFAWLTRIYLIIILVLIVLSFPFSLMKRLKSRSEKN